MRSYPSCWSKVLAQLNFRRKRRKTSKRQDTYNRRSLFENLEQRQMLSGDPLLDLSSEETVVTAEVTSETFVIFSSQPEFFLIQPEIPAEELDGLSKEELDAIEPIFAVKTVQAETGPQAILSFNPAFAENPPNALQKLRLELRQDGRVTETYDVLIDIAEEIFRERFLNDRIQSIATDIATITPQEKSDWLDRTTVDAEVEYLLNFMGPLTLDQSQTLAEGLATTGVETTGAAPTTEFLTSIAKRQAERKDVFVDNVERVRFYSELETHTQTLKQDRLSATTDAELQSVAEREKSLRNTTLLLARDLQKDLQSENVTVAQAARLLRDELVAISGPYETAFAGLGVDREINRKISNNGDEKAVSFVETGRYVFNHQLEIDLGEQQAMVQVIRSSRFRTASAFSVSGSPAVEDGSIDQANDDINGGTDTSLHVDGTVGSLQESLIRFNLAEVATFNDPTTIASAALQLTEIGTGIGDAEVYVWNGLFEGPANSVSDWDETNVNWIHIDEDLGFSQRVNEFTQINNWNAGTSTEVDVTSQLQRALLFGDANGDGIFSAAGVDGDIEAFHLAVTNWDAYVAEYSPRANSASDLLARADGGLGDGTIDTSDISDFFRRHGFSQGDYNLDGTVQDNADSGIDGLDWAVFNANYGLTNARFTQGDGNFDGIIDNADFDVWFDSKSEDNLTPEQPELMFWVRPEDATTDIEFAAQEHATLDGPTLVVEEQPDLVLNKFSVQSNNLVVDYAALGTDFSNVKVQLFKTGSPDVLLHETSVQPGTIGSHEVLIATSVLSSIVEGDSIYAKVIGTPSSGTQSNTANDQLDFEFSTASIQTVNSLDDAGMDTLLRDKHTLRELLVANETLGWFNTLTFDDASLFSNGKGTITLGDHDQDGVADALQIKQDIAIAGPGPGLLSIDARLSNRVFNISDATTANLLDVSISDLTISEGYAAGSGGAILNYENLTLDHVAILNSVATVAGGGIYHKYGKLSIDATSIDHNQALHGGGVYGIFEAIDTLDVAASTFSYNTATLDGGGIVFKNVDYGANSSGKIVNSTFSGNSSGTHGGGLIIRGALGANTDVTLVNTTVTGNHALIKAGGIFSYREATVTLHNTIVAGNTISGSSVWTSDAAGPIGGTAAVPSSNNLIGYWYSGLGLSDGVNGNQTGTTSVPLDPRLAPLESYDSITATHVLMGDSPAIDAGNDSIVTAYGTEVSQINVSQWMSVIGVLTSGSLSDIGPAPYYEGDLIVDTLEDGVEEALGEGFISLREAILLANMRPGLDDIKFKQEIFQSPKTILLAFLSDTGIAPLVISSGVNIVGPGAELLTIDGRTASSVFSVGSFRGESGAAEISGLTVTGTNDSSLISVVGRDLTLDSVVVTGNATGRGIKNSNGSLLTVINSTVSGNASTDVGGGILNYSSDLRIEGSTISGNSATDGGGVYSRNTDESGGEAQLDIVNSTVSGNYASGKGGGIFASGTEVTLTSTTIANNRGNGGGIYSKAYYYEGLLHADNTIIAENTLSGSSTASDVSGPLGFTSTSAWNLLSDAGTSGNLNVNNNQVGLTTAEVGLTPLGDYGGPTQTHALLPDSLAIDAGSDNLVAAGIVTDQRGYSRIVNYTEGSVVDVVDIGAFEANLIVTTAIDENAINNGQLSLREALGLSTSPGTHRIEFAPSLSGETIVLNSELGIVEMRDVDIVGLGADLLTIDANESHRVIGIHVGATATISGLTVTGGYTASGAGIHNAGDLTLQEVVVTDNTATNVGGGIYNISGSKLWIDGGRVSNNEANFGGGIYNFGDLTLTDVTLGGAAASEGNTANVHGGGIYNNAGTLRIDGGLISKNKAVTGNGGGILTQFASSVNVTRSEIDRNVATEGGGIHAKLASGDVLSVIESSLTYNVAEHLSQDTNAGAIYVSGPSTPAGNVELLGTTVAYNRSQDAQGGTGNYHQTGAIYVANVANTTIVNSTISSNFAADSVGGLSLNNSGLVEIMNSTIAFNKSAGNVGGVQIDNADVTAHNTIIADNRSAFGVVDKFGSLNGASSSNLIGGSAGLAALGDYGGLVLPSGKRIETHALLPGSLAIDRGTAGISPPSVDQRGYERVDYPVATTDSIDIGAHEAQEHVATGDFNGDGREDYALLQQQTPPISATTRGLITVLGGQQTAGPGLWSELVAGNWSNFQAGDFNGDGRDDIAFQDSSNGEWYIAISDSTQFNVLPLLDSANQPVANDWQITSVGDFDGDGSDELIGRDDSLANWEVIQYDEKIGAAIEDWGIGLQTDPVINPNPYTLFVGDVNRDGLDDLVGRRISNATGTPLPWRVILANPESTTSNLFTDEKDYTGWFEDYDADVVDDGNIHRAFEYDSDSLNVNAPYDKVLEEFSWVYNNVELELYPGLMKGITATEQTKAGNPWDQAALLVDKLETAGFEADIATGRVRVQQDKLAEWLGIDTANAAFNIVKSTLDGFATIPQVGIIELTHAWVRAKVPTADGFDWVDLDPSWKFQERLEGVDVNLDPSGTGNGTFDEFEYLKLSADNKQLPLEYYEDQVQQYLAASAEHQGKSLADVSREGAIIAKSFEAIPAGLGTGVVLSPVSNFATYDNFNYIVSNHADELTHQVTIGFDRATSDDIRVDLTLPPGDGLASYSGVNFDSSDGTSISLDSGTVSNYGSSFLETNSTVLQLAGATPESYLPLDNSDTFTAVGGSISSALPPTSWVLDATTRFTSFEIPSEFNQPGALVIPAPPNNNEIQFSDHSYHIVSGISTGVTLEFEIEVTAGHTGNVGTGEPDLVWPQIAIGAINGPTGPSSIPPSSVHQLYGPRNNNYTSIHHIENPTPSPSTTTHSRTVSITVGNPFFPPDFDSLALIYVQNPDNPGSTPASGVIRNLRYRVPGPGGLADINYNSQRGAYELELTDRSFKALDFIYTITPNTHLQFDFLSNAEGVSHVFGWDTDTDSANNIPLDRFAFYGSTLSANQKAYTTPGLVETITIPLDQFLNGRSSVALSELVFGVDDGGIGNSANSIFSNVRMFELEPVGPPQVSGGILTLTGQSNAVANANYVLTKNTILEFDFRTTSQGDSHTIGWDSNSTPNDSTGDDEGLIHIYGTGPGTDLYTGGTSFQPISIPLKNYISSLSNTTINIDKLVFGVDGGGSNPNATSIYQNVRLREAGAELEGNGSNRRVKLIGNTANFLGVEHTITPRTWLEFEFQSTQPGSAHVIGWDTNSSFGGTSRLYQIAGTGNSSNYNQSQNNHAGNTHIVQIPIGEFVGGAGFQDINNLVFINEGGNAYYGKFAFFEADPPDTSVFSYNLVVPAHSTDSIQITYDRISTNPSDPRYNYVLPELKIDGQLKAGGSLANFLQPGDKAKINLEHRGPTRFGIFKPGGPVTFNQKPGELVSIALDANQHSRKSLNALQFETIAAATILAPKLTPQSDSEGERVDAISKLLSYAGAKYWDDFNTAGEIIADLTDTVGIQQWVGSGVVVAQPDLLVFDDEGMLSRYIEHLTYGFAPRDMAVDLPNATGGFRNRSSGASNAEAFQLVGYTSSALEHNIIEEQINSESVSTMKGLLLAVQNAGEHVLVLESKIVGGSRVLTHVGNWSESGITPINQVFTGNAAYLANSSDGKLKSYLTTQSTFPSSIYTSLTPVGSVDDIRILVPSEPTSLGDWDGAVHVIEKPNSLGFKIQQIGEPVTNGADSINDPRALSQSLSQGNSKFFSSAGDPVNTANGNMFRDDVDIAFANLGVPLSFARHYDSQNEDDLGFGVGWTHSFSDRLIIDPKDTVPADGQDLIWVTSNGQRHTFKTSDNISYEVPAALHGTFETDGVDLVYRDKSGIEYTFERTNFGNIYSRLKKKVDLNGDGVELLYGSGTDRLSRAVDVHSQARRLGFFYDANGNIDRIQKVIGGPVEGTWTYGVDGADSQLTTVTYPTDTHITTPLVLQYEYYDSGVNQGLMEKITELNDGTDPGTIQTHAYEYYPNGRVFRVTDSEGNSQTFNYNLFRKLTEFTDENGNTETYIHQDNGLTTKQIHPDRTRQEFTWGLSKTPEEFLMQSSTNEVGAIETFTYYDSSDFRHRELYQSTEKHFPNDSSPLRTEFDYSRPASKQHIINVKSITVDPGAGNENIITSFTYDNEGRLETTTDALGNITEREYYANNDLPIYRRGLLKSETSPRGTERNGTLGWEELDGSFHVSGDTLSVRVDFDGSVGGGDFVIADAIRIDSVDSEFAFTKIIDDDEFHLTNAFQTNGTVEYSDHPANANQYYGGDRTIFNNAVGATATWTFEGIPAGDYRVSATWLAVASTRRDDVHYYLADGTLFGASPSKMLDQRIAPDDITTRFETVFDYDVDGNVISATTDGLPATAVVYDHHGNIIKATDPAGVISKSVYDVIGRLRETGWGDSSSSALPLAEFASTLQYDSSGRLRTSTDPLGNSSDRLYDSKGNLTKQINPDGTFVTFEYDGLENSNLLSQTDQLGRTTRFRYDSRSRLIETIHPDGASERVRYNGIGQVAATIDALGNETKFTYDAAGRLLKTINADGKFAENSYDDVFGRLFSTRDFNGNLEIPLYDDLGRTIQTATIEASSGKVLSLQTIAYDAAGNVTQTAVYDTVGLVAAGYSVHFISVQSDLSTTLNTADNRSLNLVQVTEIRYDNLNRPVETINADGTSVSIVYDNAGRIKYTFDELGRKTELVYDEYGRLQKTIAPDPDASGSLLAPETQFQYDAAGNQTAVIDANDNTTQFEYDVLNRVVTTTDAEGGQSHIVYDTTGQLVAGIDALGRAAYTQYDERGRAKLTRLPDPDGDGPQLAPETRFKYDAAGNLLEQIDPNGFSTKFEYDELNRLIKEEFVSDSVVIDSSSPGFDPYKGSEATVTNQEAYGGDYQRVTATEGTNSDQAGVDWIFTDLPAGTYRLAVSWVADLTHSTAVGVRTLHGGQNVSVGTVDQTVSPKGFVRSDGEGTQEWEVIDQAFEIAESDSHTLRIRLLKNGGGIFSADAALVERISSRTFTYDDNGNLETETDTLGNVTNYTYDALNRVKTVELPTLDTVDANGTLLPRPKTTTSYDGYGNVTKTIEDRGGQNRETHWTYDGRNRVLTETLDATGTETIETEFIYDEVGNLIQTTDAWGTSDSVVTNFEYDDLNRLKKESISVGGAELSTESTYDALGNLVFSTGNVERSGLIHTTVTEFTYDNLGRQTSITRDPFGTLQSTATFEYDAVGNLVRTIDPLGQISENNYDRHNRLIESIAPDPDSGVPGPQSPVTTFEYDIVGNLVAQTNGEGETERFVYDSLGRLIRSHDALDVNLEHGTERRYDSEGNLLAYTDPNDNLTTYAYDNLNRLTSETITLPVEGDVTRSYTYNAQGNLEQLVDRNGRKRAFIYDNLDRQEFDVWYATETATSPDFFIGNVYDTLGRVIRTYDSDFDYIETFVYDDLGRVIEQRNYDPNATTLPSYPKVVQRWDYDELIYADPEELERTYYTQHAVDASGTETPIGSTTTFTDLLGRTVKIEDAANLANGITDKQIEFTYDTNDRLEKIIRTADSGNFRFDTDYSYDRAGRVKTISHLRPNASPTNPFTSYDYQYDRADRITKNTTAHDAALTAFTNVPASLAENFIFDAAGQLLDDDNDTFAYDDNGNRQQAGVITIGAYNRLLADANYTYTYDNEGNLTTRDDGINTTTYTWDHRNRLTSVEDFDANDVRQQEIDYRYNADDQLVERDRHELLSGALWFHRGTEHYVYSGSERVLTFGHQGDLQNRTTWGPGVDQLLVDEVFDANGDVDETLWAATDHLGSVNQLIDNANTIVEHREYDSFGAIDQAFDETGATKGIYNLDSDIAFAGRTWDDDAQLYYNRARWYEPESGRFIGEDPAQDGSNWYAYAGNDPVNFRDPSGLSAAGNPLNVLSSFDPFGSDPTSIGAFLSRSNGGSLSSNQDSLNSINDLNRFALLRDSQTFANPGFDPSILNLSTVSSNSFDRPTVGDGRDAAGIRHAQAAIRNGTPLQAFSAKLALGLNGIAESIQGGSVPFLTSIQDVQVATNNNASFGQRAFAFGAIALELGTAGQAPNPRTLTRSFDTHTLDDVLTSRSFTTQVDTFTDSRVLSRFDTSQVATAPNQGAVTFVTENLGTPRNAAQRVARDFESGTIGAFSDVASQQRSVPALRFNNPNPNGAGFVKFDGVNQLDNGVIELIDAKTRLVPFSTRQGPFISPSVRDGLVRKSLAVQQNPGVRAVLEFPTAAARREAQQVLRQLNITNLSTRVRP